MFLLFTLAPVSNPSPGSAKEERHSDFMTIIGHEYIYDVDKVGIALSKEWSELCNE